MRSFRNRYATGSSRDENVWADRALAQAFMSAFEGGETSSQHFFIMNDRSSRFSYDPAVPNFEELSKGITDVVYRAFFKNFCDRCSNIVASDVPPLIANVLLPRLKADSVIIRAAALRWPKFASDEAKSQRMRKFCAGGVDDERENCKRLLLDIGCKAFSPACQLILDRIWDQSVPLEFKAICEGISPVEPADEALVRAIIESALSIQIHAENAETQPADEDEDDGAHHVPSSKRGSFGGCDSSCSDDHYGMACDVCGVDYGWHQGERCLLSSVCDT